MSAGLHSASKGLGAGWSQVRNKIRTSLHQLISHSELISEDSSYQSSPAAQATIAKILVISETILHETQSCDHSSAQLDPDPGAKLCKVLLDHFSELRQSAQELQQISLTLPGVLQNHDRVICATIASLEGVLLNLGSPPAAQSLLAPTGAAKIHVIKSDSQPSPLIAPIEYLVLLLVFDDDEGNRDVLSRRLLRDGYEVMLAESGRQALRMLNRYSFDLVLLDIMMPEMDGICVLGEMKSSPKLNQLPVIMITAVDEIDSIAHCIEAGADDYLLKPFNPVLLRARIRALLERKRLQDEQTRQHAELEAVLKESRLQAERAEKLLLNILPGVVAAELREHGSVRPMYFEDVTIVFADIVGFTLSTEQLPADELVELLHQYFTKCDNIVARYGLEKLKTIGDCYMLAGGLPVRNPSHPVDSVLAATEMIGAMEELSREGNVDWQLRVGIHTGPVIAGVVGIRKFAFDIWGDSVNFASRVEACGGPGRINLSVNTYTRVKDFFACERREKVRVKDGKEVEMFFVRGIASSLLHKPQKTSLEAFQGRYAAFFRKELRTFPAPLFESTLTSQQCNRE